MSQGEGSPTESALVAGRRLDSLAWGLFFVWVGIAIIAHVSWGLTLLGVGAITLGAQLARKWLGLGIEGFWVAAGVLFVLGAVWDLFSVRVDLVPIVLIIAGVALLLSAARRPRA